MSEIQFRVLYRQFLFRMVDLELLSSAAQGDIHKLLGRFAALLIWFSAAVALAVLMSGGGGGPAGMITAWAMEHFLIATTILVVGLFAVVSWDSMFPDRRDVLVLAPLPVRARTLFFAKLTAVAAALGLSIFVLNAFTGLAAPLAYGGAPRDLASMMGIRAVNPFLGAIRLFAAYWVTMAAAGVFTFGFVLSVQGIAQLLPRQKFLRVSAFLQIAAFVLFVSIYFMQLPFASPTDLLSAQNQGTLVWLPSYWFFGKMQELNGSSLFFSGPDLLTQFTRRAWIGLGFSIAGAAAAYLICYFRTLRKIAEQPDILPSRAGLRWLPRFGSALATAVVQFSIRTLTRSRKHRVTIAFYLGIAFAIVLFISKAPDLQKTAGDPWRQPTPPVLMATILIMCSAIVGIRVAFAMPMELRANWIFRVNPLRGGAEHARAARRSLYSLSFIPIWLAAAAVLLWRWPWRQAAGHLAVMGLIGIALAEACLLSFRKIPFTCSYLPGKSHFHIAVMLYVWVAYLMGQGVDSELRALNGDHRSLMMTLAVLAAVACALRAYAFWTALAAEAIEFEDVPAPAIMVLGLNRDGSPV